jgi:hypothetical protein
MQTYKELIYAKLLYSNVDHQINSMQYSVYLIKIFFFQVSDSFSNLQLISEFQIRRCLHTFNTPGYTSSSIRAGLHYQSFCDHSRNFA